MFAVFSLLNDIDVSYKTVERLYSDPEVIAVLHNLHFLILKKKGIDKVDGAGNGTGYGLTIKINYASEVQKLKDKIKTGALQNRKKKLFVYSFNLIDIRTRMYVGVGSSFRSEKEAYRVAIKMAQEARIKFKSMRLDRYFSGQSTVRTLVEKFGEMQFFLIPKSNATVEGQWQWKRMLDLFVHNIKQYLEEYYQRNHFQIGFAEDKRRTGWNLGQRRPDRIDTANFLTSLWHNLFWLG